MAEIAEKEVCEMCEGTGEMHESIRAPGDGPTCYACEGEGMVRPEVGFFADPFVRDVFTRAARR